jgi:ABC-2 type transport system ATP-binding protein
VIEIQDLYKYYGDRRAVGPLSASIAKGEIIGLLGLNGAGKTTTLRILACDLLPSAGSVRVDGIDVVERPDDVRRMTGYLPDAPPLYGEMSVREFLGFAARLRGIAGADVASRVATAAEQTAVGSVLDDAIATLSHGFRQRVGIAQAIVHNPRLVVLDEPIAGLDPVQIVEMRQLVRSLAGEHTVLVSSHILSEVSETCDRILVIRDGEIVAQGTEAELSSRLLQGVRVNVTVHSAAGEGAARAALERVAGVGRVEPQPPAEPGADLHGFRVDATSDVRPELCKALVEAGIGLVEMARSERELESVFLRLARPDAAAGEAAS